VGLTVFLSFMNEETKTRIEKEAVKLFADNGPLVRGYIMGATAENTRAWNAALEKVADMLREGESDHLSSYARRIYTDLAKELESLKIKE
jgi:hypothetical protein